MLENGQTLSFVMNYEIEMQADVAPPATLSGEHQLMLNVRQQIEHVRANVRLAGADDAVTPAGWVFDLWSGFVTRCHIGDYSEPDLWNPTR